MKKIFIHIFLGPILFILSCIMLTPLFGSTASKAIGTLLWMVYWWVTRAVDLTITAGLPIVLNAVFNIVPMNSVLSQYSSSSLILIFGSGLLSLAWANTGLDVRIAMKALSLIGPSMKSQIIVWFSASAILSVFMPNVAVCALYCPIAVAMLHAAGYQDITQSKQATYILMAIGWGAGIGGAGSPLGGAMNITAISYLQAYTNQEFMYIDWLMRITPYMIIVTIFLLIVMIKMSKNCEPIQGTKDYFTIKLNELPPMNNDEKISAIVFCITVLLSFIRPLYVHLFPGLEPAYVFLLMGGLMFVFQRQNGKAFITWQQAEKESLWGMMILFGGGIALGTIINNSGAASIIAQMISKLNLNSELTLLMIFALLAVLFSELTNSTVCASVLIPIALSTAQNTMSDPKLFWIAICIFMNAEFLLPISVRAIPASYGLNANIMLRKGFVMVLVRLLIAFGYLIICINLFPWFTSF
ncbi:MAG: SLC13 family permease [Traorella sp.]